jgi:glycosyltransferase involved in cell wall biosynthesis
MPSRHEGFGLVALEAISAGVPVLVSKESGLGRMLIECLPDEDRRAPRTMSRSPWNFATAIL